uniref:Cystin-1 n=1 Tax=Chelydra serpentina TaxID=8475 RepID=A0A8C3TC48_CHESE
MLSGGKRTQGVQDCEHSREHKPRGPGSLPSSSPQLHRSVDLQPGEAPSCLPKRLLSALWRYFIVSSYRFAVRSNKKPEMQSPISYDYSEEELMASIEREYCR